MGRRMNKVMKDNISLLQKVPIIEQFKVQISNIKVQLSRSIRRNLMSTFLEIKFQERTIIVLDQHHSLCCAFGIGSIQSRLI